MKSTQLLFLLILCLQTRQISCMDSDNGSGSGSDDQVPSGLTTSPLTDTDHEPLISDDTGGVLSGCRDGGDSDIEDDGGQPIEPIQPTKKIWHRPTGYIGLVFVSGVLSVIGMVKLYTWYYTPQQVDQEEEDEIDEPVA